MEKLCLECDKEFTVPNSRANAKYCSNKCRIIAQATDKNIQRRRKNVICKHCTTQFEVANYLNTKFCGKQCYWDYRNDNPDEIIQSNQKVNKIKKICKHCQERYEVFKYRTNSGFCSQQCHNEFRRESIICPTCNSDFIVTNYQVSNNRKYCSEKCSVKGVDKRKSKFSQSVLGFIGEYYSCDDEECIKNDERKVFGDIILKEYGIIIECNGDYWHCNPRIYSDTYYHTKIGKTASEIWQYDKDKCNFIISFGYDIITVWEYDWNNDDKFFNNLKIKIENKIYKNSRN